MTVKALVANRRVQLADGTEVPIGGTLLVVDANQYHLLFQGAFDETDLESLTPAQIDQAIDKRSPGRHSAIKSAVTR